MLGHHALIYASPAEFLACALEFVRLGVTQGDSVLVASPHAAGLAATVAAELGEQRGLDVVDDQAWHRVPAWTIGQYARKAERSARRGGRLRVLAQLRWDELASGAGSAADWQRYEAVLNAALADLPIELCCAFDATAVPADVVEVARCTHPTRLDRGGLQTSPDYLAVPDFLAGHPQAERLPVPADALRLEFGANEIPQVRQETLHWARAAGLPEDDAQEYLIAVYEIVSNAVEHGGGRGVSHLWSAGSRLFCQVWSARTIPDPMAGYRPPGTAQERGRGLWLARQICEQVTIHNSPDGTVVQLTRTVA